MWTSKLKWLGLAPIYDSGASQWYNTQFVGKYMKSKPFSSSHDRQIKMVSDIGWFDFDIKYPE